VAWLRALVRALAREFPSDWDDLVQEGWVAMWRASQSYDETKDQLNRQAWLRSHGRWRVLTLVGRLRDRRSWDEPVDPADLLDSGALVESVDIAYHRGEIQAALACLSPRQREYVEARFWTGLRGAELAALFGYDPQALWSARTGARGKLQARLGHLRELVR
jgi:RNA polymerase sigma factor (sigma-70 family)